MRSPVRTGISEGAITSQATPSPVSTRKQVEPARPGLVADRQTLAAAKPLDEAAQGYPRGLDLGDLRLAARRRQHGGDDRELVHVKRDPQTYIFGRVRVNIGHGWSSGCLRLWPIRPSTPQRLTREHATREGQPPRVHAD